MFRIEIPLAAILGGLILYQLPRNLPKTRESAQALDTQHHFDWQGIILLVALVALALEAVEIIDGNINWGYPVMISLLVILILLLILFTFVELRVSRRPIIPLQLLRARTTTGTIFTNTSVMAAYCMVHQNLNVASTRLMTKYRVYTWFHLLYKQPTGEVLQSTWGV